MDKITANTGKCPIQLVLVLLLVRTEVERRKGLLKESLSLFRLCCCCLLLLLFLFVSRPVFSSFADADPEAEDKELQYGLETNIISKTKF